MKKLLILLIGFVIFPHVIHAQKKMQFTIFKILQSYVGTGVFDKDVTNKIKFEDSSGELFFMKEYKNENAPLFLIIESKDLPQKLTLVLYSREIIKADDGTEGIVYGGVELNTKEKYKVFLWDNGIFFLWSIIKTDRTFWVYFRTLADSKTIVLDMKNDEEENKDGDENDDEE